MKPPGKIYNDFRATRPYENGRFASQVINAMDEDKRAAFGAMVNRVHFFTMVDERDSAQAIEKGLTANFTGSHTLFINDSLNWTAIESRLLAELFYPDVKTFKRDMPGTETLISIDRARELIGYEPEFTFGG